MGRPTHYSAELPARCQALIERYGERIGRETDPHDGFNGPLKTTFLLAMATPMLVLPLERILPTSGLGDRGVADDLPLDKALGDRVAATLGDKRPFGDAPFYRHGAWSYSTAIRRSRSAVSARCGSRRSRIRRCCGEREGAPASDVLMVMRNGLAHGGVTYLDRDGRHTHDTTHMLGFREFPEPSRQDASSLAAGGRGGRLPGFPRRWTRWLGESGAADAMQAQGPGYYDVAAE